MKTDVTNIYSDLTGRVTALEEADKFSAYHGLSNKSAMHLRLLTEEAVSMVNGILDGFTGKLWFESDKTKDGLLCRIWLTADKDASLEQEEELLSVSTSGKNERSRGIIGKLRQLIRISLQQTDNSARSENDSVMDAWYQMGTYPEGVNYNSDFNSGFWSLERYRKSVEELGDDCFEENDELEKSIIAKLSDDVKVGLISGKVEICIEKKIK